MNDYIKQQIEVLEQCLNSFIQGCELSINEDGIVTKEERRKIKKVKKHTKKYKEKIKQLSK